VSPRCGLNTVVKKRDLSRRKSNPGRSPRNPVTDLKLNRLLFKQFLNVKKIYFMCV
jgi:hypothetical protein